MSSRYRAAVGVLGSIVIGSASAADDLPGLSLQLARELSPPASRQSIDDTERALLRVEWKSAQSGVDEAAAVGDMLARLDRMGRSVAQLQAQMATAAELPASAPAVGSELAEPAGGTGIALWLVAIAAVAAPATAVLALRRRRRPVPLMEATTFEPIPTTLAATQAGAPSGERGVTLASPTIGTPPAFLLDERPPIELDQPPPLSADEQIPLELADILLTMGLTTGAAKTLEEYVREHPRQALCHWLKLLDIYRRTDMQAEFAAAARDLRLHFNIAPTEWQPPAASLPTFALESYPHIRSRLQHLWRRRSCIEYLNQLLEDNRGGTRTGFPQPVVEEILFLLAILRS